MIDAEARQLDAMLDEPDPLAVDAPSGMPLAPLPTTDATGAVSLQMIATSTNVDLVQRSPLVRHEELVTLKLALLDRKREVLLGLRRTGTVDDLVVRRISARLDLEQVRLQGIEELD